MNLSKYVPGTKVKIDLINGFYYLGSILSVSDDSIEIRDKNGQRITLRCEAILFIREVHQ